MSTGAPSEADVRSILDLVSQVTLARYFAGIALTLCVYDWLILIERESQTVWKARWNRTRAIYHINRVMTLVGLCLTAAQTSDLWEEPLSQQIIPDNLSFDKFCTFYIWFVSMLQWASFCMGNTILVLRIVALYNRHVIIVPLVYSLLVLNWIMTLVFTAHSIYLLSLDLHYAPPIHLCATGAHSPTAPVIFIGPAIFECILFSLTLYRAIQDIRNRVLTTNSGTPFLAVLYRDGLYYFAAIFAVHIWNSLAYLTLPMTGIFMGVYFAWSVMTVMSSRIYLNLVLIAHNGVKGGLHTTDLSFPTTQIARGETTEGSPEQVDTFGAKNIRHSIPLTTFTTTFSSVGSSPNPHIEGP